MNNATISGSASFWFAQLLKDLNLFACTFPWDGRFRLAIIVLMCASSVPGVGNAWMKLIQRLVWNWVNWFFCPLELYFSTSASYVCPAWLNLNWVAGHYGISGAHFALSQSLCLGFIHWCRVPSLLINSAEESSVPASIFYTSFPATRRRATAVYGNSLIRVFFFHTPWLECLQLFLLKNDRRISGFISWQPKPFPCLFLGVIDECLWYFRVIY